MITIIKINEGFCVVDLDEDTEVFDSLEEAQEIVGNVLMENRKKDHPTYSEIFGKVAGKNLAVAKNYKNPTIKDAYISSAVDAMRLGRGTKLQDRESPKTKYTNKKTLKLNMGLK